MSPAFRGRGSRLRFLFQPGPEVVHEPGLAARIPRRIDRLLVPLEQALRVREASVLLGVAGRRQQEYLGADLLGPQLAALDFRRVVPEGGRLHFDHVADDQPFELGQRLALQPRIRPGDGGILSHDEEAFDLAVHHVEPVALMRVVAVTRGSHPNPQSFSLVAASP